MAGGATTTTNEVANVAVAPMARREKMIVGGSQWWLESDPGEGA
jgi:hypothetical protein